MTRRNTKIQLETQYIEYARFLMAQVLLLLNIFPPKF